MVFVNLDLLSLWSFMKDNNSVYFRVTKKKLYLFLFLTCSFQQPQCPPFWSNRKGNTRKWRWTPTRVPHPFQQENSSPEVAQTTSGSCTTQTGCLTVRRSGRPWSLWIKLTGATTAGQSMCWCDTHLIYSRVLI